jgi:uroporphyrinogen decarboxylase
MPARHRVVPGRRETDQIMNTFRKLVLDSARRLAMPIAVYPGIAFTGAKVRDVVTNAQAQAEASIALRERYRSRFALSAMDLSVEAEAFGCQIHMTDDEIPTALGSLVTNLDQAKALPVPQPGDKRTGIYLETVSRLKKLPDEPLVLGGLIGPFSLAGRIVGLSEACGMTITDPALMHLVLAKSTEFLIAYARAFRTAGADGVVMAEPAAGLLSPKGMAQFSSAYIRQLVAAIEDRAFTLVLHNCAAKLVHLPAVLESGARAFHFGAPMDLVAALGKVGADVVLCGNLDPTAVFWQSTPGQVRTKTADLLQRTRAFKNFVASSGCDVPPASPLANLDAFMQTVAGSE